MVVANATMSVILGIGVMAVLISKRNGTASEFDGLQNDGP